ncbi:TetR/AcrR family transcriptional regulator [Pedobacter antarcticus]|uniref:TetR/AcrR family transcriptional regulator n=1 Tax=Pedobacter antarcticus TaxID=34086 RepID=UPI000891E105|nr:TetR/AcrR family transcriptional regulator [Pedobacter antarcticus]SDM37048.1 transcriptional regulator, TetR family [Pedobacter antarcticus]
MKSTKDKIIDGTVFCLNRNEKASIDEIASHLDLNRRTIHRYFKDRNTLIECCKEKMMATCNRAMNEAYESSNDALRQIENMFYTALTIGTEYSFVKKLFDRSGYSDVVNGEMEAYDNVKDKWFKLIATLQERGAIKNTVPIPWIYNLFGGMIDIAIAAQASGDVAVNEIKKLSWAAFKGSIGIVDYLNENNK